MSVAVRQEWAWKITGVMAYLGGVSRKVAKEVADQCNSYNRQGHTGWYKTAELDAVIESTGAGPSTDPEMIEHPGGIVTQVVYVDPATGAQFDEPAQGLERQEIPAEIGEQDGDHE